MTSPEIDCREDCDDLAFAVQKCQGISEKPSVSSVM